jgi:hypothetical protein
MPPEDCRFRNQFRAHHYAAMAQRLAPNCANAPTKPLLQQYRTSTQTRGRIAQNTNESGVSHNQPRATAFDIQLAAIRITTSPEYAANSSWLAAQTHLRTALFDPSGLTRQATQIEQPRPANFAPPHNRNRLDPRCVQQKRSLDTDPMRGNSAYREVLVDATTAPPDYDTLVLLNTLAATLNNSYTNSHRIANPKFRNSRLRLPTLNGIN